MVGTVAQVNSRSAMVAVVTDRGDYSIFEVIGGEEFEEGDVVSWAEDAPLGGHNVRNHRSGDVADVFFQNHYISKNQLRQQLLL